MIIVGVDATRSRSGGAKAHLIGILSELDPLKYRIKLIHIWGYSELLDILPERPWLIKHLPIEIKSGSIIRQMWWQFWILPKLLKKLKCNVVFNTDAGSVCYFKPGVTLSQDMLSFEPGEMKRFGFSIARLRLLLLLAIQIRSLTKASMPIFLTNYSSEVIQRKTGLLNKKVIIPHGIGKEFHELGNINNNLITAKDHFKIVYVSNVALYKHQWHVVNAINLLRSKGYNLSITFVGGGKGKAQRKFENVVSKVDQPADWVIQKGFMSHEELIKILRVSDIFLFASSCENMPVTLLEGMAAGLPIICSNRGPMPEILQDGGLYFNPENVESISNALKNILDDLELYKKLASRSKNLANQFTWEKCADATWNVLSHVGTGEQKL
jgi:glycosyltransferase involved in cell wall biosynthesis